MKKFLNPFIIYDDDILTVYKKIHKLLERSLQLIILLNYLIIYIFTTVLAFKVVNFAHNQLWVL